MTGATEECDLDHNGRTLAEALVPLGHYKTLRRLPRRGCVCSALELRQVIENETTGHNAALEDVECSDINPLLERQTGPAFSEAPRLLEAKSAELRAVNLVAEHWASFSLGADRTKVKTFGDAPALYRSKLGSCRSQLKSCLDRPGIIRHDMHSESEFP